MVWYGMVWYGISNSRDEAGNAFGNAAQDSKEAFHCQLGPFPQYVPGIPTGLYWVAGTGIQYNTAVLMVCSMGKQL